MATGGRERQKCEIIYEHSLSPKIKAPYIAFRDTGNIKDCSLHLNYARRLFHT